MTPFAQLGQMTKQAVPAAGYKYQVNAAGLNDPYLPQVAKNAPKGTNWGLLGADVALGSIPVVGGIWGLGRAGWDAAHGNWGGAAANLAMAGAGAVGLGGLAAGAKAGVTAGRIGMAARAASSVAKASQGTGLVAKGAQGVMRAGAAANTLKAAGPTVFKGTKGVANPTKWGSRQLGKMGPVTAGRVGHAGAYGTAITAPGALLPDGSPAPLAPPPTPTQMPAWQSQMFNTAAYGG
jgi:hypothetical protein